MKEFFSKVESGRDARRTTQRDPAAYAWEVWAEGDRWEKPVFVAAFKDKGQAQARVRRMQTSQRREGWSPAFRYFLKRRRVPSRLLFGGGHKAKRSRASWMKRVGW
jgi:hypothetical protein